MTELTPSLKDAIFSLTHRDEDEGLFKLDGPEAKALLAALPADLVAAATVEMPKEPGLYVGPGGTRGPVWRLDLPDFGTPPPVLYREGGSDTASPTDGPFRRLVAEGDGPTHVFTGKELRAAWEKEGRPNRFLDFAADYVNTYTTKEA